MIRNKYLFIYLFFVLILPDQSFASVDCNQNKIISPYKSYNIKNISIEILNQRKWYKNLYKAIFEADNVFLKEKFKKRYDAKLKIRYKNDVTCELNARVRLHGDTPEHYALSPPSLSVRLTNGNLNNFTDFILFRPDTRGGDNEIFASSLAKHLGFISPDTFYLYVNFNGTNFRYLLQERVAKELLEYSGKKEGPIFEGDERHVYDEKSNENLAKRTHKGLVRMTNPKWALKNDVNLKTSLNVLENLNNLYQDFLINLNNGSTRYFMNFDIIEDINPVSIENLYVYHAFLYSIKGTHGLAYHNRKFYYDSINDFIHPIFYDTDTKIFTLNNEVDHLLDKNLIIEKKIAKASDTLLRLLNNISIDEFQKELITKGLNIDKKKINEVFLKIKKNIDIIKNLKNEISKPKNNELFFENIDNFKHINLGFYSKKTKKLEFCDQYLKFCRTKLLSEKDLEKLLSQRLTIKNDVDIVYIGESKTNYKSGNINKIKSIRKNLSNLKFDNFVLYYKDSIIEKDLENKSIKIAAKNANSFVVIYGEELEGWSISYDGLITNSNFNYPFGLTGCVNIFTKKISLNEIKILNANCEDAINFVNTSGYVKNIEIKNSKSDAIDADFSSIIFKNILIDKSKNDCSDFSYGNYKIFKIKVNECGDKGVSVGEASKIDINNLEVYKSDIGIASKDSSYVNLNYNKFFEVENCVSIYNKKIEFNSSTLNMLKNLDCKNKLSVENGSILKLN